MAVRPFLLSCSAALLLLAALFSACATGEDIIANDDPADGSADGTVVPDARPSGSSASGGGASSSGGSSGASSSSSSGLVGQCGDLKVNEVRGASDDFVEIYNAGDCDVALGAYSVVYRSATGTTDVVLYENGTDTLAPQAYFVIGETSMSPKDAPFATGALSATGGQLAIKKGSSVVDSLAYGSSTGSYAEGNSAPAPGSGSISRSPNGTDSDDNADDFRETSATPGEANQ